MCGFCAETRGRGPGFGDFQTIMLENVSAMIKERTIK
jgi:hypothetical protein